MLELNVAQFDQNLSLTLPLQFVPQKDQPDFKIAQQNKLTFRLLL